jgi:hypothetical protein
VRLDPAVSPDTRLTFCTTGILLRRLAGDGVLRGVTHVVVDEVHERSLQGDFLLALLRRLVAARAAGGGCGGAGDDAPPPLPRLKVVLMSATIDLQLLSEYFGWCPRMTAQGRTFPVKQLYLEDVYEMTGYNLEADSAAAVRTRRDRSFQKQAQKQAGARGPAATCHSLRLVAAPAADRVAVSAADRILLLPPPALGQVTLTQSCGPQASTLRSCARAGATTRRSSGRR